PSGEPAKCTRAAKGAGSVWIDGVLLLATVAIVASATFGDWMVLTPDSLGYLGAARSVWESQSLPGVRLVLPPGFPLLIAPLMARGDLPFTEIRAVLVVGWAAV